MLPKFHLIISLVVSFVMLIFGINIIFCLFFFLAAFLIDVDHYFYYIFEKKDFNPVKAYKYLRFDFDKEVKGHGYILMIFHTIEFFFLLLVLSLFFNFFLPILLGCLFHEAIDLVYGLTRKDKKYKRGFSLIYYLKTR